MNGFDLRAIGWVITCDICAEIIRVACGATQRIEPDALRTLLDQWRTLQDARIRVRGAAPLVTFESPSAALSPHTARALEQFVEWMTVTWPSRYSAIALRQRCLNGACQVLTGWAGSSLLAGVASSSGSVLSDAALVLLVMALWSLLRTVQLWRIYRMVKRLASRRRSLHSQPESPT